MSDGNFSLSTISLKISFLVLIVVLILHLSGYLLAQWSYFKLKPDRRILMDISYDFYTGLWKDCLCVSFKGDGVCYCDRKGHTSGSFFAVQVLETLGLIGLTISGIITCLLLFTRQKKALKIINIFIAFCSGAVLAIGVVVYAVNCKNENDTVFPDIIADLVPHTLDPDTSELSTSFILCTIAGCLCLLGFTALLLVDLRTASVQSQDERQQSRPVEFSDQGQSSLAQGKAIIQTYALPS